jgi:hypothetical protein
MSDIPVAVAKYARAEVGSPWPDPSVADKTDTIWTIHGSTPAMAWPVMFPWAYSSRPKLAMYAKIPFCIRPVAALDVNIWIIRKAKYPLAEVSKKSLVDNVIVRNTPIFISKATKMRFG